MTRLPAARGGPFYRRQPPQSGWRGRVRAGRVAIKAFVELLRITPALQIQVSLCLMTLGLGVWRGWHELDYLLLAIVYGTSLQAEARNTVAEQLADLTMALAYRQAHPESDLPEEAIIQTRGYWRIGQIKDHSAGAVTPIFLMGAIVSVSLLIHPL